MIRGLTTLKYALYANKTYIYAQKELFAYMPIPSDYE